MDGFPWAYQSQPHEVSIETLAKCNAACVFCPYPTLERIGTKMPDELLDRLVGEMSEWKKPFFFSPFKVNEPLLDKRLIPLCKDMNDRVPLAQLRIFTNGSPLTEKKQQQIDELENVEHLWVSLNEVEPDQYLQTMGLDFDKTARNLDRLHESAFRHKVVLSRVGSDRRFLDYCLNRWPKFEPVCIKRDGWLGYVEPDSPQIPDSPCIRWWELSIMADGVVSLCCMDGEGAFAIGDVKHRSMLDVYNDPGYRGRRDKMLSRKKIHPCSTCTY